MEVSGKYVLITGANRGIGLAFAQACAVEKAHIILAVRKLDVEIEKSILQLGAASVKTISCDLITRQGVQDLAQKLQGEKVDILFNNAGLLTGGLLEEQPLDDIYNMFQVNVNALVHLTHAVLPKMIQQKSGKIINHASVSAIMHFPCASTYAASKAAVWAFTDCVQREVEGTGVSTLCLFTPGIKTRMFDKIDELYSKNFETPKDSISPEMYAQKILKAVKNDQVYLQPDGATGVAFRVAQNFKSLFNKAVSTRFRRTNV
jgi:uncharacterized protein